MPQRRVRGWLQEGGDEMRHRGIERPDHRGPAFRTITYGGMVGTDDRTVMAKTNPDWSPKWAMEFFSGSSVLSRAVAADEADMRTRADAWVTAPSD